MKSCLQELTTIICCHRTRSDDEINNVAVERCTDRIWVPYTVGTPLDCYVIDFVVRPGSMTTYYGSKLLQATLHYFIELLNRGVVIHCIYAAVITKYG